MVANNSPKKSETLEIRLAYETKIAFMARCRRDGRSASEAMRALIEQQLTPPRIRRPAYLRLIWASLAGLAIGAGAAPSLARVQQHQPGFDQLDRNHDGVLSVAEYVGR